MTTSAGVAAVRTEGLSKRYGRTLALDSLDLTVDRGEVYGYLGPNGAGKTTIRLLLGLHRPGAGTASLFGVDARRADCVPITLLCLGLSALAYAAVPRASSALSYVLVCVMFLWYLVGSVLGVPAWVVGLTPFRHIGFLPAQSPRVEAAVVMTLVGVASGAAALLVFRRRDLVEE